MQQVSAQKCGYIVKHLSSYTYRYLRAQFRKYLENNDEDPLLLFWEYAEDYKMCHAATHRFDEQIDFGMRTPKNDLSQQETMNKSWPQNYRCSTIESKQFAEFVFTSFLKEGARYQVKLAGILAEDISKVEGSLPKAARNLFVPIQKVVMRELLRLFYSDFSRSHRYREHFLSASMDLFGCYEVWTMSNILLD